MIAIDRSIDDFVRFSCRSNIRKISFSYVEIMNVLQSIESMDFMTNVNVDIISNSGKHLPIVLIVYLLPLSSMKKSSVATEVRIDRLR